MAVRYAPYAHPRQRRRPGLAPMQIAEWIEMDRSYTDQIGQRDRLIEMQRDVVFAESTESRPAQRELLDALLDNLTGLGGFDIQNNRVLRPDGITLDLEADLPLVTVGRLVQEDFCIMEKGTDEYVLTAAILCFPSRWSLAEKIGRPLTAIHGPVPDYNEDLAKRVNRVFEGIKSGLPLWRANWTVHGFNELHQPSGNWRGKQLGDGLYIRVERQSFVRLPKTEAVVFGIRTYIDPLDELTPVQANALHEEMSNFTDEEMQYHSGQAIYSAALARLAEIAA